MIYFLDGNQEVIKIVRNSAILSAIQTQELPEDNSLLRDYLSVRLKNDERLFNAQYMAVKTHDGNRNAFDLYRIASELVPDNATEFMGVQVAPYELEGVVIEDLRPQNRRLNQTMNQVLEGSDWRIGYVADNLPNVTTNFYYVSVKDALKKIQELTNVEMLFKVEISGNKITDKWVEVYHQLGNRTMKRFNYGTNALSVVRESSHDELYTALIGRGKGEEVGETESGDATYGRKINFADVEWKESAGKPVDKPKGQKYIELPNATAEYGIKLIDGRKVPRIGIVDFSETDDPEVLIEQTYQELLVRARPKVLFKASVINTGDMLIGDTVTIHRHDLDFHYQARVRKVVRDRKNNNKTQVEIGDVVHTASTKRQGQINSALNNVASDLENVRGEVTEARDSADGKNVNNYGNVEPERKKVGDTWFRDHPSLTGESQILVWNGEAWELTIDTSETTKNAREIEAQQQEIEDARQVADEAVEQIDTAVANAGFTSLDDTLQSINHITMNADQSAQEAITNASNAYGLAQTSISEAQTAQANSLTALGQSDDALAGVSDLDLRVDDVEAELELKADNTFMNEDGELVTLSNAITFNAHRFSSDMSRIESRVESLAGEINLVILRNAFENTTLLGGEVYPNATANTGTDTMGEMINVVAGEQLYLSKSAVAGDRFWRISFYLNDNYVTRIFPEDNEYIATVPSGVNKMWVSYPKGSKPQITRGSGFVPYRPNIADQMTSDEVTIFRNEYDEFADKTERRMTAIDSSSGRLATAEFLITQTADGLALKADQTTVDELTGEVESLGTEFDVVAGQVSSRVWKTDIEGAIDGIEVGGRNLVKDSESDWIEVKNQTVWLKFITGRINVEPDETYTYSVDWRKGQYNQRLQVRLYDEHGAYMSDLYDSPLLYVMSQSGRNSYTFTIPSDSYQIVLGFRVEDIGVPNSYSYRLPKLEKGNIATDWSPAPEDTDAKISHIETEWTQTFDTFSQTVTDIDGRVTTQKQTIDTISSTVSGHGGRISTVEQTASGLQSTVADKANQSQVTQLANGLTSLVSDLSSKKNHIPYWEVGGIMWANGQEISADDRIRTPLIQKRQPGVVDYSFSEAGTSTIFGYVRYYRNGNHYDYSMSATGVTLTDAVPCVRLIKTGTTSLTRRFQMEVGGVTLFAPYASDVSQSQISQLSDNINLRVEKGDVINQINVSDENILIQSKRILLDGDVTIRGTAWMDGAVIKNASIDGAKIQDATIGSAKIASLDVGKISGNTANFVRANFNSSTSALALSASGITSSGGIYSYKLDDTGVEYIANGVRTGVIRSYSGTNYSGRDRGISMIARAGYELHLGYGQGATIGGTYTPAIAIDGTSGNIYMNNIHPSITSSQGVRFSNGSIGDVQGVFIRNNNSIGAGIFFGNNGDVYYRSSAGTWSNLSTL